MKRRIAYLSVIILIISGLAVQPASSQEKTKEQKEQEQKEKEEKLRQAIEVQKKIMFEQQKEKEGEVEVEEALKEVERIIDDAGEHYRIVRPVPAVRDQREHSIYITPPAYHEVDAPTWSFYGRGGDAERTSWEFSRSVKESTFSKQYSFDIEKDAGRVSMTIIGDCKEGEIRIRILMPGGKTYSDIVIDESGNLNWRKSFTISDEENKDKAGEWTFRISGEKATGSFKISLQTI